MESSYPTMQHLPRKEVPVRVDQSSYGEYQHGFQYNPEVPKAAFNLSVGGDALSETFASTKKRPNYRPLPLRWPFIVAIILVLLGFIGSVIYAIRELKNSDATATLQSRDILQRQGDNVVPSASEQLEPIASASQQPDPPTGAEATEIPIETGTLTTGFVEELVTKTLTRPGSSTVLTTSIETTELSSITSLETSLETLTFEATSTITQQPTGSASTAEVLTSVYASTSIATRTSLNIVESKVVKTVPFTTTKPAGPPETYFEVGTTRIYKAYTIGSNGQPLEAPRTQVQTREIPGGVQTIVDQPPPVTLVSVLPDGQPVTITSMPAPTTRITSVAPTQTIITSVSTPTEGTTVIYEETTYTLTNAAYFIGKFLPPIVAVLLAMPIRALDQSAKQYQPLAALSRPGGALGRDSLTLKFEGWEGFYLPFKMLCHGQPVPFLTTLAVWGSSVFAPLASEAIGLKLHGSCRKGAIEGCAIQLGVSNSAAYALTGLMACLVVILVITIMVVGRSWTTGVSANPWCSSAAAALARNPDMRPFLVHDYKTATKAVSQRQFAMGWYRNHQGRTEYGLVLSNESHGLAEGVESNGLTWDQGSGPQSTGHYKQDHSNTRRRAPDTFIALAVWWRLLFMLFLMCILAITIYYHFFDDKMPEEMQKVMRSEGFGVRFICSALGVIVVLCWECIFISIAVITPFRRMAKSPQGPTYSVLMSHPTNSISGLWASIRCGDFLLLVTGFATLLAEFLPILLANMPYNLTQTRDSHDWCARLSAAILAVMIIILFISLFVRWPDLPVDPRSLVGAMWYVIDAPWVASLEGVVMMSSKERKMVLERLGGVWSYEPVRTVHGDRMRIEMRRPYGMGTY